MSELITEKKVGQVEAGDTIRLKGKRKWHTITKTVDMRQRFGLINLLVGCKQMPLNPHLVIECKTN